MKTRRTALALVGVAALAACDIPTEAPILEQRWILPIEGTDISVAEFLPTGVTIQGNAFNVSVAPFSTSVALQTLCPSCQAFQGLTVPAPAFQGTITLSQSLPTKVSSAVLTSGTVAMAIQNQFNFDPLAGGGTLTVTLRDGAAGRQLAQSVYTASWAPGSIVNLNLALAPGAVGPTVVATAVLDSKGGQVTTIDGTQRINVTATPGTFLVSSASVNVAGEPVTIDPSDLDVEDIDSDIADKVQAGAIILAVTNPFGVALTVQTQIVYPGGSIGKTLNIGSGATSTATLQYSGDELRAFLGQPNVRFTGTGSVSSSAGTITVTPSQRAVIDGKIDLTLKIGG